MKPETRLRHQAHQRALQASSHALEAEPPGWGPCAFSEDMRHRYTLARSFDSLFVKRVLWVMLNPSTADDAELDPTIRRVRDFSLRFGFGQFAVGNLFSLRSTDPKGIREAGAEGDPENLMWLAELVSKADTVICAWGVHGTLRGRDAKVERIIREMGKTPMCLGVTKDGHPRHPLYLAGKTEMVPLTIARLEREHPFRAPEVIAAQARAIDAGEAWPS